MSLTAALAGHHPTGSRPGPGRGAPSQRRMLEAAREAPLSEPAAASAAAAASLKNQARSLASEGAQFRLP